MGYTACKILRMIRFGKAGLDTKVNRTELTKKGRNLWRDHHKDGKERDCWMWSSKSVIILRAEMKMFIVFRRNKKL